MDANENKRKRFDLIQADSPYIIRQPHSLTDFLNQQKWIQELAEIRLSIRQQQVESLHFSTHAIY